MLSDNAMTVLRGILGERRLSNNWLADEIGEPRSTVSRWLRGDVSVKVDDLDAMARALGMSVSDVIARAERVSAEPPVVTRTRSRSMTPTD